MVEIQIKKKSKQKELEQEEENTIKYSKKIIRESREKSNFGRINDPDIENGYTGPCGDTMNFFLKIDNKIIKKMNYLTNGCIPARACANILCKMVKNMRIEEILLIKPEAIIKNLEHLPHDHEHCAELAIKTLNLAIKMNKIS